ncbi:hypothetical protein GCM10009616_28770 [Microlunatus lacustris]
MESANAGIYTDFEGYRTHTDAEVAEVLLSGTIALDTNVLLDLYRYGDSARSEFLTVLDKLAPRLFVPHQVMREFWSRRISVLEEVNLGATETDLEKAERSITATISRWVSRTRADEWAAQDLLTIFEEAFDTARERILKDTTELDVLAAIRDTTLDPVLLALDSALTASVGAAFTPVEREKFIKQGRARFEKQIPPGYRDAEKQGQPEEGTGDYLLWEQLLRFGSETGRDLIFVTRDGKDDWWRVDKRHNLLGPRPELVLEYGERTKGRFFMLPPQRLLEIAATALQVTVSSDTIADAERISTDADADAEATWTSKDLRLLLDLLSSRGYTAQVSVIEEAIAGDGSVSRARVYEIVNRIPGEHKLTGFTKPVIRAVDDLVDREQIPRGLKYPLVAMYDTGAGKASRFAVPKDVVQGVGRVKGTREELISDLALMLDMPTPVHLPGSRVPGEIFQRLAARFDVEENHPASISAAVCLATGLEWTDDCESSGGMISIVGLSRLKTAVSRLLKA